MAYTAPCSHFPLLFSEGGSFFTNLDSNVKGTYLLITALLAIDNNLVISVPLGT